MVCVEKKKNELVIVADEKQNNLSKIKEFSKASPIFIIINNSQVIQKEINEVDANEIKILNKAFPNLKQEDFYYEIATINAKSVVAVCRKSYVDDLLKEYKGKEILFSGLSIGVCSISNIAPFVSDEILQTNSVSISLNEETIIKPLDNKNTASYSINGLSVKSSELLGFAALLGLILKNSLNTGNIIKNNSLLLDDFYQKSFFKKTIKTAVYVILGILVINFFVFNYYFKAVNDSNADLTANKNLISDIKSVRSRLKLKEEKLNNSLSHTNSKSSFIINELVKNIPSSILLEKLEYHPVEKKIKEDEPILTLNDVTNISGKTINNVAFTKWIETIEAYKWVKNVTITHFGKNETNQTVFTIKIKFSPNEAQ
eukprot:GDKJ01017265.1.p3 GENE.GDKJ01017265.1~~GDKJ01017265.1.p3  ORF type:complete len:372 (-),score=33.58 GDKJ01017265.1:314-1429(-)